MRRYALFGNNESVFGQKRHLAVVHKTHVFFRDSNLHTIFSVGGSMEIIAVYRHKEFGLDEFHRYLQVGFRRVAGGVNVYHLGVVNHRALAAKVVLKVLHAPLVARDDGRGEYHHVALFYPHVLVLAVNYFHKSRVGLPLRAGCYYHYLVVFVLAYLLDGQNSFFFVLHVAQRVSYLDAVFHRAAVNEDLAADLLANLNYLRNACKHGRESGEDYPAFGLNEKLFEVLLNQPFGNGVAVFFGVGRVNHKGVDAHFPDALKVVQAGRRAMLVIIKAEIGKVHDVALRRFHHHSSRVWHCVVNAEKFQVDVFSYLTLSPLSMTTMLSFGAFTNSSCLFSMIAL